MPRKLLNVSDLRISPPAMSLRLRSAWPALSAAPPGCTDPGSEALEGTLVRVDDAWYEGRFVRSTTLRFCGPHGVAARGHCGGALVGTGVVRVVAEVEGPGSRPTLSVEWQPMSDSTQVTVKGDCPAGFATALERLYRSAPHAVEFELPVVAGSRQLLLDDYGWVLEIE